MKNIAYFNYFFANEVYKHSHFIQQLSDKLSI